MLVVAVVLLPILLTHAVHAQSMEDVGLKINGAFISGERKDFKDHVEWSARVTLTIRNDGTRPVILLDGCFAPLKMNACAQSVTFYTDKRSSSLDTGEIIIFKQSTPENLYPIFWKGLLNEFDQPMPPSRQTPLSKQAECASFLRDF
jgi:hypothetical protein